MGTTPHYAAGDVIANKYVVERPLGESVAGHVFLVNEHFNSQKMVVKFYRPEVSVHLLAAPDFFLKAASMTELEHDNLCASIDVQEEMGLAFVARGFAEGQSLEEWLRKAQSDSNYFPRGLELLWQASQGLIALHERTRHLNIHPGNIIVGNSVAKLCDWDPRALTSLEMTSEALPLHPDYRGYRAPEISASGSFLSYPSTDLFAVAGLLFRLIKGSHPAAHLQQNLQDIRALDRDIAVFLTKAMHPKPEELFQEAGSFSDALWDLKPAMERLRKPAKEEAEDSLFQFYPPTPEPVFGSSGDTLFGSPPIAPKSKAPVFEEPVQEFPDPVQDFSHTPKSGLESLEAPGTLFGSTEPLFSQPSTPQPLPKAPPQPPVRPQTPPQPPPQFQSPKPRDKVEAFKPQPTKPLAVSLSSLEKDPLDRSGDSTAGFTQFGFKGAGDNRTGIFTPEQRAASAKTKLFIILAAVGGLILILSLGGLFFFLRGTAAPKVEPVDPPMAMDMDDELAEETLPSATEVEPANDPDLQQNPSSSSSSSATPSATPNPTPSRTAPIPSREPKPEITMEGQNGEPPQPRIQAPPIPQMASTTHNEPPPAGNTKVSPQRLAELMAMVQTRTWPEKAAPRLQAANEFNDLGKTAEANMAYSKALSAADATEKQKVSALGGLAITFQAMGMNDQAKDAVERILQINPKNSFALKLREKL